MTSKKLSKTKAKSLPKLKADLQEIFNHYIRLRDKNEPCISCGQFNVLQAGHYFAKSGFDGLRFTEENVHGECSRCNCFDHSHLIGYGENLKARIGIEAYDILRQKASDYKMNGYKWTRTELTELIEIYKMKVYKLIND